MGQELSSPQCCIRAGDGWVKILDTFSRDIYIWACHSQVMERSEHGVSHPMTKKKKKKIVPFLSVGYRQNLWWQTQTQTFCRQSFALSLMRVGRSGVDDRGGEYWRASSKIGLRYFVFLWLPRWWTLSMSRHTVWIRCKFRLSLTYSRHVVSSAICGEILYLLLVFLSTKLSLLTLQGWSAAPAWSCKAGASK